MDYTNDPALNEQVSSVTGTADNDTYIFYPGDAAAFGGGLLISEALEGGTDTVLIAGGISPDDVRTWTDTYGYLHVLYGEGDLFSIYGYSYFTATDVNQRIEQIAFDDGTVWDLTQGLILNDTDDAHTFIGSAQSDTMDGRGGDDTIYGYGGNDTLTGGAGYDALHGGTGDDTYVADEDGHIVVEIIGEGTDTLVLHNVLPEDLRMWVDWSGGLQGSYAGSFFSVSGYAYYTATDVNQRIEQIAFDDGTVWDLTQGLILNDTDDAHTFIGSAQSDTMDGRGGDDTIYGYGGNDMLDGGTGSDVLSGGEGNDEIDGGLDNDTLYGNQGADLFIVAQGSGNDTIADYNKEEGDVICFTDPMADMGNLVSARYGDALILTLGTDSVTLQGFYDNFSGDQKSLQAKFAGTGLETLSFDSTGNLILTNPNVPTEGDDVLTGTVNADVIDALGGNDIVYGLAGDDQIDGGSGNDTLDGGADADTLTGGLGDDIYKCGMGSGQDVVSDVDGVNKIVFDASVLPADVSYVRSGDDLIVAYGVGGDQITVRDFYLLGQPDIFATVEFSDNSTFDLTSLLNTPPDAKDDVVTAVYGQPVTGNVLTDNGSGADSDSDGDVLSVVETVVNSAAGFVVSLSPDGSFTYSPSQEFIGSDSFTYTVSDGRVGTDTATVTLNIVAPVGSIIGTSGADSLTGTAFGEYILGLGGNDNINAGDGDDSLYGASGNDRLYGGKGNDTLDGGTNSDYMDGDSGNDTYIVDNSNDAVKEASNKGIDLVMSSITYTLVSNVENLTLTGTGNLDGNGNGLANVLSGNNGANTLSGNRGGDTIYGGNGDDTLFGDDGKDLIYGQDGFDTLWGGTGADTFVFEGATALNNVDFIKDFSSRSDIIDISDVIAAYDPLTEALTDFLMIETSGSGSTLKVDLDGTGGVYSWTQIATIEGVTGLTDEAALVASGNLIVA